MAAMAIPAAIGLVSGLVKANQQKAEYNRQKQLAADIERNSAWTHVHGQMPGQDPNALDAALQGVGSGLSFGQGLQGASANQDLLKSQIALNNAHANSFNPATSGSAWSQPNYLGGSDYASQFGQSPWSQPTLYGNR